MTGGEADEFAFQLVIWGYHDAGALTPATAASEREADGYYGAPIWDVLGRLRGVTINGKRPPFWWSLPYVTRHLARGPVR